MRKKLRSLGAEIFDSLRDTQADLNQSIAANGGDRLERLAAEIREKTEERQRRQVKAGRYDQLISGLSGQAAEDEAAFLS